MDEFPGLLGRDFGFKPQGKSAPMAPSRYSNSSFGLGSNASEFSKSTVVFDDHDRDGLLFNDVFGGPPKGSSTSAVNSRSGNTSSFDYDSIFKDQKNMTSGSSKANSMPVYDKPVYDDDIFEGLPGLRSSSTAAPAPAASSPNVKFDDVSASISTSSSKHKSARDSSAFDDLLGNLGKKETESRLKSEKNLSAFDDLLPGFGRSSSPSSNRSTSDSSRAQKPPSNSTKTASSVLEDPFVVLESTSTPVGPSSEVFTDPMEEIGKLGGSGSAKVNVSSVSGGLFDDLDPLNDLGKSVPPVSPEFNKRENDSSPLRSKSMSGTQAHPRKEPIRSSQENFEGYAQNRTPVDNFQGSNETLFDMPSATTDSLRSAARATPPPSYTSATDSLRSAGRATSPSSYTSATDSLRFSGRATSSPSYTSATDSLRSAGRATSPPSYMSATDSLRSTGRANSPPSYTSVCPHNTNPLANTTPKSEEMLESDDVWLTVSEIPLFTQPTSAPPPSKPPPPRPTRVSKYEIANARRKANEYASFSDSPQYTHSPRSSCAGARSSMSSEIDELKDFAIGMSWNNVNEYGEVPSGEDVERSNASASAAAMKEATDRAEAKFRHAEEIRERESFKAARSRESFQLDKEERDMQQEAQERLDREMQQREKEEEKGRLERGKERARESDREREEKEREQRRREKERERTREIEKEREKARQAVERATREARERAAAEARLKAERAAVGKANAAARERAERAAVQRAQAEARERAAAEARERAERAAAEARERANAEAKEKEVRERATVARAEAEARRRAEQAAVERASAEARERVAAAARANQNKQNNDNDLESFFSSRPSSAPRPRANTSDSLFDTQSKGGPEPAKRASVGTSSAMKKASSTSNIVDDLSSIFGAAGSSAGEFQEVEGETEERRRARLERQQRTQERAVKALAEKNQRDLQAQRDQAERHRIAETLDVEIKRWAAGKEGNIRALLATLQYVLWPECGWQPVSLTDLIIAAAVKKVYRKATLCIHPDKVQQKGANLQQKYIAEKVFDLLKEAWNKFNSEELF